MVSRIVCCGLILCLVPFVAAFGQNLLNNPESVVFDQGSSTYIVSNWGDGSIVRYYQDGTQEYYNTDFQGVYQIAGLYIHGDTLLAASGNGTGAGLSMFDLASGGLLNHIALPGVGLPNDIAVDSNGVIYVTDYWDSKLYRVENHEPSVVMSAGLNYPNGMLYDSELHRLLIINVNQPRVPVRQLNLADTTLSLLGYTDLPGGDGIVMDPERYLYISEWTNDAVHKFDIDFQEDSEVFSSGHDDPADIYFDSINNLIAVPNFSSNTVDFEALVPVGINDQTQRTPLPGQIEIRSCWPNPFNSTAKIRYLLPQSGLVAINLYCADGRLVQSLLSRQQTAGEHQFTLESNQLSTGTYFVQINHLGQQSVKPVVLIK